MQIKELTDRHENLTVRETTKMFIISVFYYLVENSFTNVSHILITLYETAYNKKCMSCIYLNIYILTFPFHFIYYPASLSSLSRD